MTELKDDYDPSQQEVLVGPAFERVRQSHPLADKKIIGEGSFSVLFEGETPSSIYRLSLDNATHDFARRAKEMGLTGVVEMLQDYGAVAIYRDDQSDPDYLWLAHLERLAPLLPESDQYLAVSEIVEHLTGEEHGALVTDMDERLDILELIATVRPADHTKHALEAMLALLPDYVARTDYDLSISNFMIRTATGDVVLSDPVNGLSVVTAEHHIYLKGQVSEGAHFNDSAVIP